MNKNNQPIGVFDSGMGGLTVLRALKQTLPQESFIYLGDTARLPYGTKSPETVKQYAVQMTKILVERHIKALIVACNTATTVALPHLQTLFSDLPLVGVVRPSVSAVVSASRNHRIALLATETTVASNVYQQLISAQLPQATIHARACSLLVALAEEGMKDNAIAEAALKHYLEGLDTQDTLLLGCTHFPVFKSLLAKLLPPEIVVIDSAQATADALYKILINTDLMNPTLSSPDIHYLVTDSVSRFQRVGEVFLGESLATTHIELVDGHVPNLP